jgi:MFS family permease
VFAAVGAMNINQIVLVMLQQPVGTDVGLGVSATEAGVLHMPQGILGVIASPLVGWYAARKGGRSGMILATAVISAAWIGMVVNHASIPIMVLWMSMSGFGVGALMAAVPNLIVEVAPAERTSEATGLAQIVRKIGMTCSSLQSVSRQVRCEPAAAHFPTQAPMPCLTAGSPLHASPPSC